MLKLKDKTSYKFLNYYFNFKINSFFILKGEKMKKIQKYFTYTGGILGGSAALSGISYFIMI